MVSLTKLAFGAFLVQAHLHSTGFVAGFSPCSLRSVASNNFDGRHKRVAIFRTPSIVHATTDNLPDEDESFGEGDDDEDSDDENQSGDTLPTSRYFRAKSPFAGLKLDPWDPNPLIKPRPNPYFPKVEERIPEDQLVQVMSIEERKENLTVMRQILKVDLPDLRLRRDHAGWVEANNDLKQRKRRDPWFGVNERLRDSYLNGDPQEDIDHLKELAEKLGGPPPGVEVGPRGYAQHTQIFNIEISRAQMIDSFDQDIVERRVAEGRVIKAERRRKMEKEREQREEDMRFPWLRAEREAKERVENMFRIAQATQEEALAKKLERAKEILGKLPEKPKTRIKSKEIAMQKAIEDMKRLRKKKDGRDPEQIEPEITDSTPAVESRVIVPSGAESEGPGGRPRLPGDSDVTRGEIEAPVYPTSSTSTGFLSVEATSTYNKNQSDPSMRKHCFQYTIRITNNSPKDTVQLVGRRFEIQTVGSSMKDVVLGEGVTGRTPVLKPGDVFEYTSTAPLSVRPIGTTVIAARMRGEYRYVLLHSDHELTSEGESMSGQESTAELGTFHFIFPEDQRVKPFHAADGEEDDEEEDDDEDDEENNGSELMDTTHSLPPSVATSPASTLPGDSDIATGEVTVPRNDSSEFVSGSVKVAATSSYRPERSDTNMDKHCFAYNVRITNESDRHIQLLSRRFEVQTIGSYSKDVVEGPGVTGLQPIIPPGDIFEYTSTAPLRVRPMLGKTPVLARMQGEYSFIWLSEDGSTPEDGAPPEKAQLGMFHFVLPTNST